MSKRIYIETTVVSYYTAQPSRDVVAAGRQQSTKEFWSKLVAEFSPCVSALVIQEAAKGDPTMAQRRLDALAEFAVLSSTFDAEQLADELLTARAIPAEYPEDALHISIAAVAGVEFIVTWNFAHINNPFTKLKIRQTVENAGYVCPEIVSPDAFLGDEL